MKTILAFLVVVLALLALGYQLWFVTPGYDKEARRQYDDATKALRLYGRSARADSTSQVVISIISDVQRRMTGMRPPLRRLSWHILFVRQLGRCQRALESADGLLPLGG